MKLGSFLVLASLAVPFAPGCAAETGDAAPDGDAQSTSTAADALSVFQWSSPLGSLTASSDDAPALEAFGNKVHMVYTEAGGTALRHRAFDGLSWSTPYSIANQSSKNRPALAKLTPKGGTEALYMVHQGASTNDLWWSRYNGTYWTENSNLGFTSYRAPMMASYGGMLHLFGTYLVDQSECLKEWTYDGKNWVTAPSVGICGFEGMAIAVYNGVPTMVLRRPDNGLAMYRLVNGRWTGSLIPGQKSKSAPALAAHGGYLHMTHLGDSSDNIWWSVYDGTSWSSNVTIPGHTSQWVPALASTGPLLVQGFKGSANSTLYYSTFH